MTLLNNTPIYFNTYLHGSCHELCIIHELYNLDLNNLIFLV